MRFIATAGLLLGLAASTAAASAGRMQVSKHHD